MASVDDGPNPTVWVYDPLQGCRWEAPICRVCRMVLNAKFGDDLDKGRCRNHPYQDRADRARGA